MLPAAVGCIFFLAAACNALAGTSGKPRETEPAHSYAPVLQEKCTVRYAHGFSISYYTGYKIVTVFDPDRKSESKSLDTFVLIPRGHRPPAGVAGTVVEVPVMRVVLGSSTHVPFFSMLGCIDHVVAISQGKYVTDPDVLDLIRKGRITEVGVGSGMTSQFNVERLFTLHPDLVLGWWTNNPAFAGHTKAKEAGFPVALTADYEENTPLGRTAWVKFIAAFLDAEADAERVFSDVERKYLALAAKARGVRSRPTVMYGSSFEGSWYIAGGRSLFANLIKDAGGQYIWRDNPDTGSRPINVEAAMMRGRNADYWFTQSQSHLSLASVLAEDNRYKLFKAFQSGRVYSNNAKIGPGGGNDYYQGPVSRPDLFLADMIAILHPELLPGHKLIWHVKLPPRLQDRPAKR